MLHLRCCHEVHLEEPGLECCFARTIVLESIQKEGGALLHHVHLHEHIHNLYMREREEEDKGKRGEGGEEVGEECG